MAIWHLLPSSLSIHWCNMTWSLSLLHSLPQPSHLTVSDSATPISSLSLSLPHIFWLLLFIPPSHAFRSPRIFYSYKNKESCSPRREIAQLSVPLLCQRLSFSISSSLKGNLCHFLCRSLKSNCCSTTVHSRQSKEYAMHQGSIGIISVDHTV